MQKQIIMMMALAAVALTGCLSEDLPPPPAPEPEPQDIVLPGEGWPLVAVGGITPIRAGQEADAVKWRIRNAVIDDIPLDAIGEPIGPATPDGLATNATSFELLLGDSRLVRVDLERLVDGVRKSTTRVLPVAAQIIEDLAIEHESLPIGERLSIAGDFDEVAWEFGDGMVGIDQSTIHAYKAEGNVTVRAYARSGADVHVGLLELNVTATAPTWRISDVGFRGPEPSVGVTSSGCIFFPALEKVMRSCDGGLSWEDKRDMFSQDGTSDPWLWVDPVTDRIFNVQMLSLVCTWIAWSDDDGESWLGNPFDCGPVPVNDHIKLATGPWTDAARAANPVYPQAVYFCYNKVAGAWCFTSYDGGATFPVGGFVTTADQVNQDVPVAGIAVEGGGLHGAVIAGPEGTVYLPVRTHHPKVGVSHDNGLTWTVQNLGSDAWTPAQIKNPEVAVDTDGNAYFTWVGQDMGIYISRSTDQGRTWDSTSIRATPGEIGSVVFPAATAGSPGFLALAYYGTEDTSTGAWDAEPTTRWYQYVTYTQNALDAEPDWVTVRVWDDPLQIGDLCVQGCKSDPAPYGTTNRNHLDFIDIHTDREGRIHIAFADGCREEGSNGFESCLLDLDSPPVASRDARGMVAILDDGFSLLADEGRLPPL